MARADIDGLPHQQQDFGFRVKFQQELDFPKMAVAKFLEAPANPFGKIPAKQLLDKGLEERLELVLRKRPVPGRPLFGSQFTLFLQHPSPRR